MKLVPLVRPRPGLLALVLLATLIVLAACNRTATQIPNSPAETQEFLKRISAAMAELESVHGEVKVSSRHRPTDKEPYSLETIEFDVRFGGNHRVMSTTESDSTVLTEETRVVDRRIYTWDSSTGVWSNASDSESVAIPFASFEGLEDIPEDFSHGDVPIVRTNLRGTETFLVSQKGADGRRLDSPLMWVGAKDLLIRQYKIEAVATDEIVEDAAGDDAPSIRIEDTWIAAEVRFSRFNEPVHVEAPEVVTSGK